jgi:hypothetical protein
LRAACVNMEKVLARIDMDPYMRCAADRDG